MRTSAAAVLASVAINGVAAWRIGDRMRVVSLAVPPPAPVRPSEAAPPKPAEPEPIVVVMLPPDATAVAMTAAPARLAAARISETRGSDPAPAAEPATAKPGRSLLSMRPPERPAAESPLKLSGKFLEHFAENSKPPADVPGARLDLDIDAIKSRLHDPHYVATASPDDLAADRSALVNLREARADIELKPQKDGTYTADHETFGARVNKDGTVALRDKPDFAMVTPFLYKTNFDDAIMRAHGVDPYAHEKLAFLDRTRDQRAEAGKWNRVEQLSHSSQLMTQNLAWAWRISKTLAARKQAMFDLWDECAEPVVDRADESGVAARSGDDAFVDGGNSARGVVIAFVREKLSGADAYTPAELARLNAHRHSRAVFAPYE